MHPEERSEAHQRGVGQFQQQAAHQRDVDLDSTKKTVLKSIGTVSFSRECCGQYWIRTSDLYNVNVAL